MSNNYKRTGTVLGRPRKVAETVVVREAKPRGRPPKKEQVAKPIMKLPTTVTRLDMAIERTPPKKRVRKPKPELEAPKTKTDEIQEVLSSLPETAVTEIKTKARAKPVRERIRELLDIMGDGIEDDILLLRPQDRVKLFLSLLEFDVPKLKAVELNDNRTSQNAFSDMLKKLAGEEVTSAPIQNKRVGTKAT